MRAMSRASKRGGEEDKQLDAIEAFQSDLRRGGVWASVRAARGDKELSACGQLASTGRTGRRRGRVEMCAQGGTCDTAEGNGGQERVDRLWRESCSDRAGWCITDAVWRVRARGDSSFVGGASLRLERHNAKSEAAGILQPVGVMVVLGFTQCEHSLCSSDAVFELLDGQTRFYGMPFFPSPCRTTMWQLSFTFGLAEAHALARGGGPALLDEARRSVYPMAPFKGQGANQALLDALALGRALCSSVLGEAASSDNARRASDAELAVRRPRRRCGRGVREVLSEYEREACGRAAVKVRASREAALLLHSPVALAKASGSLTRSAAARQDLNTENPLERCVIRYGEFSSTHKWESTLDE
ncbi:MAG: hypothetical protein SGPRY_006249 [Prymnesium sp.]